MVPFKEAKSSHDRINELIEETQEPVQRAVLLVLANIARELDSNTAITEKLAVTVERQAKLFETFERADHVDRAYVRGAWWAAIGFIVVLQSLGGWALLRAVAANDAQEVAISALKERVPHIGVNDKRLDVLEAEMRELSRGSKK